MKFRCPNGDCPGKGRKFRAYFTMTEKRTYGANGTLISTDHDAGSMVEPDHEGYMCMDCDARAIAIDEKAPEVEWQVFVHEVWIQEFRVKATTRSEALDRVQAGEGTSVDNELEFSHALDRGCWTAEEA